MQTRFKTMQSRLATLFAILANRHRRRSAWVALKHYLWFIRGSHYYSPVPSLEEVRRDESRIFVPPPRTLPGVDLNEDAQLHLLHELGAWYRDLPFRPEKVEGLRYYYENPAYSYSDAILLHCMIRHLQPKRIVEVGSGFSSCLVLDTNELFFGNRIKTTFIDPFPALLESLLKPGDLERIELVPSRLQDADAGLFSGLEANDILFIDSTHVSKINSDVNRFVFEILPSLASGVYVHFHDIFYPFEYPREWVFEGRAWNEAYILRAFLQFNTEFRIVLMNTWLHEFHRDFLAREMPLCLLNSGGSLWIRKQ